MKHKDEILRLRADGKTYKEIAVITGASKGTISYHCGPGQKDKTLETSKKSRRERTALIIKLKDNPCVDCGIRFHHAAMDWDHVFGEKIDNVSFLVRNNSWQTVLNEIKKCELVCANCHRIRTYNRVRNKI